MERTTRNIFTIVLAAALMFVMTLAFNDTEASAANKPLEKGQYFKAGTCTIPGEGFGENGGYHLNDRGDTFTYNGEWYSGGRIEGSDHDKDMFYKYPITIAYPNKIKTYYYTGGGWGPTFYNDSPGSYYDHSQFVKAYVFYMITGTYFQYPMPIHIKEEDKGVPWGVQILDGDGTKASPFKFGLLFSEPYPIQVYTPEHGKVSFIPPNAEAGDTVKFTVTPDSGYEIKSVARWYFDENGASVITQIQHDEEGNCSFVMPAKSIKLDVTFVKKDRLASITHSDGTRDDYDSFEEAVAEWEDGSTLTMYEGARIERPIEITNDRTLDLNGYVLKSDSSLFTVKDGGNLTIDDGDPEGRHQFENKWYDGGHLLGSVDGTDFAVKGLIDVSEGVFAMNGGSLINQAESALKWGIACTTGAKVAINGGYVKANRAVIMDSDQDAFVFLGRARFDLENAWPIYQKLGEEGLDSNYSVINIMGGYYKQDISSLLFSKLAIAPGFRAESKEDQIDWEYSNFSYRVEDERQPYTITVQNMENGAVSAPRFGRPGDSVELKIKPDEHYRLKNLIVEDEDGFRLPLLDDTFTMPESAIKVRAEFELIPVSDVWISKEKINLTEDGSESIRAEALPYEAQNRDISWSSEDESVATVDENGKVSAVGVGKTWIKATAGNDIAKSCNVTVYHEHKMTKVDAVEANCKNEGNIEYWRCDKGDHACRKLFADEDGSREITQSDTVVPVDGDRHGQIEGFETTDHVLNELSCTSPLVKVVITNCNDCGAEINITREGRAPLGHDWGEWEVVKEATETEAGQERRVCNNESCPIQEQTRIIPAGNHVHTLVKVEAKSSTCTEPGNIEHWVCSGGDDPCGRCFADAEGKSEIEDGVETNPLGHLITAKSTVIENEKPATCEKAASYESVVYCSREGCGKELSRTEKTEGKALGHKWEWKTVDEDTHQRVCEHDDSHVETASHRWDDGQVIPATCRERGKTVYTCCDCGATKETDITKPDPNAHVFGDATYLWSSDNTKVTASHKCKYDGTVETEESDVKVSFTAPTCTEDGVIVQKAVFSKSGFTAQVKNLPGEKAPGHTWGTWKITKKATVKTDGKKEHTCSVCEEKEIVKIAKAGTVIKGKTTAVKANKLKKKAQTVKRAKAITLSKAKGTLTFVKGTVTYKKAKAVKMSKKKLKKYKKKLKSKFVISKKTGKITVKKGLKKGVYKLKVTVKCSGDANYAPYTKKVTVKIKVK